MGRLLMNRPWMPPRRVCQAQGCPGPEGSHREGPQRREDEGLISDLLTSACQPEETSAHPGCG
jgi:hypothetical protein